MLLGFLLEFLLLLGIIALIVVAVFGFRKFKTIVGVILGKVEDVLPAEERAREYVKTARRHRDRLQERVAAVKANIRVLEDRLERFAKLRDEWERTAEAFLAKGDETQARQAAARLVHYEDLVSNYEEILDTQRDVLQSLDQKLARTELAVDRTEQRAEFIRVTADVARVNRTLSDLRSDIGGLGEIEGSDDMGRLAEQVNRLQYKSEALAELKDRSEGHDIESSIQQDMVDVKLAQLRSRLSTEEPA